MSDYPMASRFDPFRRVYWDVVDFPFPTGLRPELIYSNMKLILDELRCPEGDMSIMAYVSSDNFGDELVDAYKKAGITVIRQQVGVRSMLADMAWWNVDLFWTTFDTRYRGSMNSFMVISKQIKKDSAFLDFLQSLSHSVTIEKPFNVLVALPQDPPPPPTSLQTVSFEWLLTRLLDPTDQTDTNRMRIESVSDLHETIMPSSPVDSIMPDTPFDSLEICPGVFCDNIGFLLEPALMRSLAGTRDEFSIMVYVDADADGQTFPDALVPCYKEAGITIIPQRVSKYARAHCMSVDIVLWAMENPASCVEPRNLLVLSENVERGTDLFNALEALKDRYYDVVVLPCWSFHFSTIFRNRRPKMSREEAVCFSDGRASLFKENVECDICVFWDVQGCRTGLSSILPVLRKKGYRSDLSIRPYVDEYNDEGDLLVFGSLAGDCCGVSCIKVVTQGDKYAKVTRMLLDILFWAMNHDDMQQSLILISQPSKDTKCDIVLQALERRGFNVIFRPSEKVDSFESFCKTRTGNYGGFVSEASRRIASKRVVVLWPIENCPPPNPREIFWQFISFLTKKRCDDFVTMRCYVDEGKISDDLHERYRKSSLEVRLVSEEEEFGKITDMVLDMIHWTLHEKNLNFFVISKPFTDATWDSAVKGLKDRGCSVHFVTLDYVLTYGSSLWSARSLLDGSCSSSERLK